MAPTTRSKKRQTKSPLWFEHNPDEILRKDRELRRTQAQQNQGATTSSSTGRVKKTKKQPKKGKKGAKGEKKGKVLRRQPAQTQEVDAEREAAEQQVADYQQFIEEQEPADNNQDARRRDFVEPSNTENRHSSQESPPNEELRGGSELGGLNEGEQQPSQQIPDPSQVRDVVGAWMDRPRANEPSQDQPRVNDQNFRTPSPPPHSPMASKESTLSPGREGQLKQLRDEAAHRPRIDGEEIDELGRLVGDANTIGDRPENIRARALNDQIRSQQAADILAERHRRKTEPKRHAKYGNLSEAALDEYFSKARKAGNNDLFEELRDELYNRLIEKGRRGELEVLEKGLEEYYINKKGTKSKTESRREEKKREREERKKKENTAKEAEKQARAGEEGEGHNIASRETSTTYASSDHSLSPTAPFRGPRSQKPPQEDPRLAPALVSILSVNPPQSEVSTETDSRSGRPNISEGDIVPPRSVPGGSPSNRPYGADRPRFARSIWLMGQNPHAASEQASAARPVPQPQTPIIRFEGEPRRVSTISETSTQESSRTGTPESENSASEPSRPGTPRPEAPGLQAFRPPQAWPSLGVPRPEARPEVRLGAEVERGRPSRRDAQGERSSAIRADSPTAKDFAQATQRSQYPVTPYSSMLGPIPRSVRRAQEESRKLQAVQDMPPPPLPPASKRRKTSQDAYIPVQHQGQTQQPKAAGSGIGGSGTRTAPSVTSATAESSEEQPPQRKRPSASARTRPPLSARIALAQGHFVTPIPATTSSSTQQPETEESAPEPPATLALPPHQNIPRTPSPLPEGADLFSPTSPLDKVETGDETPLPDPFSLVNYPSSASSEASTIPLNEPPPPPPPFRIYQDEEQAQGHNQDASQNVIEISSGSGSRSSSSDRGPNDENQNGHIPSPPLSPPAFAVGHLVPLGERHINPLDYMPASELESTARPSNSTSSSDSGPMAAHPLHNPIVNHNTNLNSSPTPNPNPHLWDRPIVFNGVDYTSPSPQPPRTVPEETASPTSGVYPPLRALASPDRPIRPLVEEPVAPNNNTHSSSSFSPAPDPDPELESESPAIHAPPQPFPATLAFAPPDDAASDPYLAACTQASTNTRPAPTPAAPPPPPSLPANETWAGHFPDFDRAMAALNQPTPLQLQTGALAGIGGGNMPTTVTGYHNGDSTPPGFPLTTQPARRARPFPPTTTLQTASQPAPPAEPTRFTMEYLTELDEWDEPGSGDDENIPGSVHGERVRELAAPPQHEGGMRRVARDALRALERGDVSVDDESKAGTEEEDALQGEEEGGGEIEIKEEERGAFPTLSEFDRGLREGLLIPPEGGLAAIRGSVYERRLRELVSTTGGDSGLRRIARDALRAVEEAQEAVENEAEGEVALDDDEDHLEDVNNPLRILTNHQGRTRPEVEPDPVPREGDTVHSGRPGSVEWVAEEGPAPSASYRANLERYVGTGRRAGERGNLSLQRRIIEDVRRETAVSEATGYSASRGAFSGRGRKAGRSRKK